MKIGDKIEAIQIAAAIVVLGLAVARTVWPVFAPRMDTIFLALVLVGFGLLMVPLKSIKSLKAAGVELSLDAPPVQAAVASLNLSQIEYAKLRAKLQRIAHILPAVAGSRLLWIDDRPENITMERRLLRALGVTIVPA